MYTDLLLLRIAFWSLILMISNTQHPYPIFVYKIYDGLGEQTMFPYENGHMDAGCSLSNSSSNLTVLLRGKYWNGSSVTLATGTGKIPYVRLNLIDYHIISCFVDEDRNSNKYISYSFICDPMPLVPPISDCSDNEICMTRAAGKHSCEVPRSLECYNGIWDDVKPEKYVCINGDRATEENLKQGLCTALKKVDARFSGTSGSNSDCNVYENIMLGREIVEQGSCHFISLNNIKLELQFSDMNDREKTVCSMKSSAEDMVIVANITDGKYKSKIPALWKTHELTRVVPLDLSSITSMSMPKKFKLTCTVGYKWPKEDFHLEDLTKSTSMYFFIFNENQFKPSITTTVIDASTGFHSLTCKAQTINGILFSILWDREPNHYFDKTIDDKIITNRFDDDNQTHTCYVAAFAYQHPYRSRLVKIELPLGSVNNSIVIEKGGVPGKCFYDKEHKNTVTCDGKNGNVTNDKGKETSTLSNNLTQNASEKAVQEMGKQLIHLLKSN